MVQEAEQFKDLIQLMKKQVDAKNNSESLHIN